MSNLGLKSSFVKGCQDLTWFCHFSKIQQLRKTLCETRLKFAVYLVFKEVTKRDLRNYPWLSPTYYFLFFFLGNKIYPMIVSCAFIAHDFILKWLTTPRIWLALWSKRSCSLSWLFRLKLKNLLNVSECIGLIWECTLKIVREGI